MNLAPRASLDGLVASFIAIVVLIFAALISDLITRGAPLSGPYSQPMQLALQGASMILGTLIGKSVLKEQAVV
jgi:hypothetical protein